MGSTEISDWFAFLALCASFFALWRSESTAKDQLATELFVAAHSVISVTTEAFPILGECWHKYGTPCQDDLDGLTRMQRNALAMASKDVSSLQKKEIRKEIGILQADRIHAERCIRKYQKHLRSKESNA